MRLKKKELIEKEKVRERKQNVRWRERDWQKEKMTKRNTLNDVERERKKKECGNDQRKKEVREREYCERQME